jgi:hypothetical protein
MADTPVDRMLADPRLASVLDDFVARIRTKRPVRWHRLIHTTLHCQMHASPDLATVTDMKWRLAYQGIETTIASEWLTL